MYMCCGVNTGDSLDVLDVLDEKQEDKQHSSDSPSANNPSKDSPVEDDNPENHMIVESFPPVMVTCHQDAYIRFWDLQVCGFNECSSLYMYYVYPIYTRTML